VRQDKADSKGLCRWMRKEYKRFKHIWWRVSQGEVLPESPLFVSASRRNRGARIGYDTIDKLVCQLREQTGIESRPSVSAQCDELSVRWDESVSCDDADTSQVGTEFPTVHEGSRPARQKRRSTRRSGASARPNHP